MTLRLLCATANPGKVAELVELLAPVARLLARPPGIGEVDEPGETLEANALIKAHAVADSPLNVDLLPAIADDTGLEVDALGGAPGVHSARYAAAGPAVSDAANRALLLANLAEIGAGANRRARFRTVVAVVWPEGSRSAPQGHRLLAEGVCSGTIAPVERGSGGFGYDSVFIPDRAPVGPEGPMTFAEMGLADKQQISHRGRAIAAVVDALRALGSA